MKKLKIIVLVVVSALLVVAMLQNRAEAEVRFLWWSGSISTVLLLLLTCVGGFILGLLSSLLVRGNATTGRLQKGK